jgi:hypothetical protein
LPLIAKAKEDEDQRLLFLKAKEEEKLKES